MSHTTFKIVEQHDGRYITVAIYGDNSYTPRLGETIIPYENDTRSLNECFSAIADYVVDSGLIFDHPTIIEYVFKSAVQ